MTEIVEYTVVEIGTNTLAGMLCRQLDDGEWVVDSVEGKQVIVNYEKCLCNIDHLSVELSHLYERGATKVTLVRWIPEHERQFGSRVLKIPRQRADRQVLL